MNTSGKRLRSTLDAMGIQYVDFAAALGVEAQHVNNWFSRGVPKGRIFQIADHLGINPRWLADGIGPQHGEAESPRPFDSGQQPPRDEIILEPLHAWDSDTPLDYDEVELPLFKEVELASGDGRTAVREEPGRKLRFSRATLRNCNVDPEHAVFATNSGNSNYPLILHGSTIGIDTGMTRVVDGEIYALDHDGLLRVKFLQRLPGGGLRLRSFNHAEYQDEDYGFDQIMEQRIRILGRVFWWSTIRPLKSPALI